MDGWNDTILNTTSNIGLNYEKVNTIHTNKNIKTWFLALECYETEAVYKHNGIHRAWYMGCGTNVGLFLEMRIFQLPLPYENI